jgi:hypothetical protein
MGKENNTNQTYIKRRFIWYQVLCTSVGRSRKPWGTIKVDIVVEQSRFWVYQTPLHSFMNYRSVKIMRFFKYMFRAHTSKTTNQKTHMILEYKTETCIWKSQYHKVMWSEKVRITCSMKGSCATYLTLFAFIKSGGLRRCRLLTPSIVLV